MKKLISLILALVMVMGLAIGASAQTVEGTSTDGASITVSNASKGETYKVYKVFSASVTGTDGGSIAYTGTIPTALADVFEADTVGNISVKEGVDDADVIAALKTWAETATPVATAESDGSELEFTGLDYGYYVVTSTQSNGAAITVTSTNPKATVVDKNSTVPGTGLKKEVDDDDVSIGDTVTYTVSFQTANYVGSGADAKKIVSYTISDTLPEFLSNVTVTSIKVNDTALEVQQFNNKQITIAWVDKDGNSLYANGATITITYTAVVTDKAVIDGEGNTNTVTLTWTNEDNTTGQPDTNTAEETIYTYAIALKKVNDDGKALAGATFQLPFYVSTTPDANGAYIYAGTTAGDALTNTVTTPESGEIVIKGVASGPYSITETAAPAGYNKLAEAVSVTATKIGETTTSTTTYLDENGNVIDEQTNVTVTYTNNNLAATVVVVVNKTGSELPSTGGMGTTLFYVIGGLMMAGAAVLLVTKRRVA